VAAPRMDRKLAAIMAVDVVGYSRLVGADEAGTLARVKAPRKELAEPLIAEHHGRVVKLTGDGALVEFASAVDAVECAVALQAGMAEREAAEPEARRIRYRIGINIGDIVLEDGDIFGDGVNVAARLEGLAEPGGICIARNVYNQVKAKLDLAFEPMGEHRVKNIAEPVTVYRVLPGPGAMAKTRPMAIARALRRYRPAVIAAAVVLLLVAGATVGWYALWQPGEPLPADQPSIAVLPFDNLSGDAATGRLADGTTEDIITDLARFAYLDVIARNSTLPYKDKPVDVRQIGKELNVRYVLEGSIQRQADRVRVTAQLIDAAAGAHVWSERWDRPAQDLFAVQTELAESVANRIGGHGLVEAAGREVAKRKRPENLTAYDLYLLGIEAKHRLTEESLQEAVWLFQRALELDPQLARAWTGLAWAYVLTANFGGPDRAVLIQKQLDAARRAVQLDPMDAEAHVALGDAVGGMGDFAQAKAEHERALQLNPNSDVVLHNYTLWASAFGEPEKGVEAAEKFIRLNPNYPTWATHGLSYAFFHAGRYDDSLQILEKRPEETMDPDQFIRKAGSLAALGRAAKAQAVVTKALARFPDISIEKQISPPGFADHERQRYIETMRKAGFPACAKAEELAQFEKPIQLPECESERARTTPARS
jgi:TolB-like protein/class 3 adenylate cyclase/Tfp pilus assembly protein PilF